jgi:hypothetical protein
VCARNLERRNSTRYGANLRMKDKGLGCWANGKWPMGGWYMGCIFAESKIVRFGRLGKKIIFVSSCIFADRNAARNAGGAKQEALASLQTGMQPGMQAGQSKKSYISLSIHRNENI